MPDTVFLEPFAGANSLIRLIGEAGIILQWSCYDIQPPQSMAEGFPLKTQDTLKNFPQGYTVAITNPPYLARYSATRRGLPYPNVTHNDVYKAALSKMLDNLDYVAAIVPESFLTSGLFHDRLSAVISLQGKMFSDTSHPVCLALFVPHASKTNLGVGPEDFKVYNAASFRGFYRDLVARFPRPILHHPWRFNDPKGTVGMLAVDGRVGNRIRFVEGKTIDSNRILHTSRLITRISGCKRGQHTAIIAEANRLLEVYREVTDDVMLTAFKGLRADGTYRRRLDFSEARGLLDAAMFGQPA